VPDPYDSAGGDPYYRWRLQLTPAAAQAKLGALVKGALIGIQVTQHGASPRIVAAGVVGSAGSTSVTGSQLQEAFGLLSTYARFTTITATPGPPSQLVRSVAGRPVGSAAGVAAAVRAVARQIVRGAALGLHGVVFPARAGIRIAVQRAGAAGSWRTVAHARVRAGGSYGVGVPGPGSYRVLYSGLAGPVVGVR
jgi:hypothetical protein